MEKEKFKERKRKEYSYSKIDGVRANRFIGRMINMQGGVQCSDK